MSTNLDLLIDPEVESAHPENDICLCLSCIEDLDRLAKKRKVKTLSALTSEEEDEGEGGPGLFDAATGIATIEALLAEVRESGLKGLDTEETDILVEELEDLLGCLRKAAKRKARFCFIVV